MGTDNDVASQKWENTVIFMLISLLKLINNKERYSLLCFQCVSYGLHECPSRFEFTVHFYNLYLPFHEKVESLSP